MSIDALRTSLADRYRIERELGQGGMATVYLAHDIKHDRKVAIKVLKPELAAVLGAERFLQEIKTTAALQHPHILPLFDSGTVDGRGSMVDGVDASAIDDRPLTFLFYVMPYIEGETLRGKLDRETQLGIDESVRIATDVASALHYAHQHGVIHRDIKPENILLHDGRPMVMDFGIALAVSAAAGGRMTETGLSLGTPHYMSPEQATAEREITARSDQYSLASVLYEMLTGNPPHLGGSAQQIIMKIIAEEPAPVTRMRKAVPANVAAAVAKSLEKLPADRFESSKAFAEALANPGFTVATTGSARHESTGPIRSSTVVALAAALVLAMSAALWGWLRTGPPPSSGARWVTELTVSDSLTFGAWWNMAPSLSADGSILAIVAGSESSLGVYVRHAENERFARLEGTGGVQYAALSPDGRSVAFRNPNGLFVIPSAGGERRRLEVPVTIAAPFAWLDNDHVMHDLGRGIFSIPVSGAPPTRLTTVDSVAGEAWHVAPSPLPGGGIVYAVVPRANYDADGWRIRAVKGPGASPVDVTDGLMAKFTSNRHLMVRKSNGTIVTVPFDAGTLSTTGDEVVIVGGLRVAAFTGEGYFSIAESGEMVYLENPSRGTHEVVSVGRDGSAAPLLPGWTANIEGLSLSSDGQRLAVGHWTPVAEEIVIHDLSGANRSRVRVDGAQLRDPAWAPDGESLYFAAASFGSTRIFSVPAEGGSEPELKISASQGRLFSPSPTADGRSIYFWHRGDTYRWMVGDPAERIEAVEETREAELGAVPSPNGRWLAFVSREQGQPRLVVRSTDPARPQLHTIWDTGTRGGIRWNSDGTELFWVSQDSMRVARVNSGEVFSASPVQALFPMGRMSPEFDVSADGRFIMARRLTRLEQPPRLMLLQDWKARLPQ